MSDKPTLTDAYQQGRDDEHAALLGQAPALQARQVTEEFIEDLTEYAMWLRNMDDHYSRQAVSRDLQQMAAYYTQRVNDPDADAQDTHPTLWGRLAWANRG